MKSPRKNQTVEMSRQALAEHISGLSSLQQREILKIIKQHNVPFSTNKNGHFFDMDDAPPQCLREVKEFVAYSLTNMARLDAYERSMHLCLKRADGSEDPGRGHHGAVGQLGAADDEEDVVDDDNEEDATEASAEASVASSDVRRPTPAAIPVVKFINCKKKFGKAPRGKKYDPDDVTCIVSL